MVGSYFRRSALVVSIGALLLFSGGLVTGCASSDKARLKESRDAYLKDDFDKAEAPLFSSEVYKNDQNRLMHYYLLSSVAMSKGEFEKAVYFLDKARDTANSVRSGSGMYEWFSKDYKSNPIEYSYIHYLLVMAYTILAEDGKTPAWTLPEIKDSKGTVLVSAQSMPARTFDAREIADFRSKARSELLAWDSFLQDLKRTYPTQDFYKEDVWARLLASYLQGLSSDNNERRTSELLADQAKDIFQHVAQNYPTLKNNQAGIEQFEQKLVKRAQGKGDASSLFVVEAGVMSKYKIQRFMLGMSTLFSQVKDPHLRRLMEAVGLQVILNTAPEFGLIMVGGAVAGAVSGSSDNEDEEFDGPPRYFSDAVDRSLGFEIRFPAMQMPPSDTKVDLSLTKDGQALAAMSIPIVSPVQELIAVELKKRENSEMFARAVSIGLQYVAILVPAIIAYRHSGNNIFKKLAIVAGYYIAKKVIDNANEPDLRSWSYLPQFIAADMIEVKPGDYDAKITIQNHFGRFEKALGKFSFGNAAFPVIRERIGNLDILNRRDPVTSLRRY
jgi:hypothetical protein